MKYTKERGNVGTYGTGNVVRGQRLFRRNPCRRDLRALHHGNGGTYGTRNVDRGVVIIPAKNLYEKPPGSSIVQFDGREVMGVLPHCKVLELSNKWILSS